MLLLTIGAGREFQIITILLKKKCFASLDLKRLPTIVACDVCEILSYIVVYVDIAKAAEHFIVSFSLLAFFYNVSTMFT